MPIDFKREWFSLVDLYFNLLSYWIARRLINMTVLFEFLMTGFFPWRHGLGSCFLSQTLVLFLFFYESPWDLPHKSDLSPADGGKNFGLKVNPRSFNFHGDYSNSLCQIESFLKIKFKFRNWKEISFFPSIKTLN